MGEGESEGERESEGGRERGGGGGREGGNEREEEGVDELPVSGTSVGRAIDLI